MEQAFLQGLKGDSGAAAMNAINSGQQLATFPGWSGPVATMFALVGLAIASQGAIPFPLADPNVNVSYKTLWHRVATDTTTTKFNFFNTQSAPFVTNMPLANQLPTENAFWITNVRAKLQFAPSASLNWNQAAYEYVRNIHENCEFTLRIGDRVVIDRAYGLSQLPEGSGLDSSGVFIEVPSAAATYKATGSIRNGANSVANKMTMVPTAIAPTKTIAAFVEFAAALGSLPASIPAAPYIWIGLDGYLVNPANN